MTLQKKVNPTYVFRHRDPFILDFFLSYIQPPFYHRDMTLKETLKEWEAFGKIYEDTLLKWHKTVFTFAEMEKKLDAYYEANPKFSYLYFQRKSELNLKNQYNIIRGNVNENKLLKFQMPDLDNFKIAKGIGDYFCLKSIATTYTGYNNFVAEQQNEGLKNRLVQLYSAILEFSEQCTNHRNIGFNKLNINLREDINTDTNLVLPGAEFSTNFSYTNKNHSIEINHCQNWNSYFTDLFAHEYTHFLENEYYQVFKNQQVESNKDEIFNDNFFKINETLNLLSAGNFNFSSYKGTYYNNKLYRIHNSDFNETHSDFITDYEDIIYLNITGKKLNREQMQTTVFKQDIELLKEPILQLISQKIIINTTAEKFIEQNINYLSDFISSLSYAIYDIDNLMTNKDDCFTKFISIDKYMKHSLNLNHINTDIGKEKMLHQLFIVMVNNDRAVCVLPDEANMLDSPPLSKRVFNSYPNIGLYIPRNDFLPEIDFLANNIQNHETGLTYFSLPGEMLAYSMTGNYALKPEHVKTENAKFYQKYRTYICDNVPHKITKFDHNIIEKLNILRDKKSIEEKTHNIHSSNTIKAKCT